jgi:HPt (histidine-containing phosphotransfer) domain-containing protein
MSEGKIYNIENLIELSGGDSTFICEMIHMFISHSEAFMKDMNDAMIAGDIDALKRKAHKYKTSAQLFQIIDLHALLAKLESFADFSKKQEMDDVLKNINKISTVAVKQLKAELKNY